MKIKKWVVIIGIITLILLDAYGTFGLIPRTIETGRNVTTYSGIWNYSMVTTYWELTNPQNADDILNTTYALYAGGNPAVVDQGIKYSVNFTKNQEWFINTTSTNITVLTKLVSSGANAHYLYCQNMSLTNGSWILLSSLPLYNTTSDPVISTLTLNNDCVRTDNATINLKYYSYGSTSEGRFYDLYLRLDAYGLLNFSIFDEDTLTLLNTQYITLEVNAPSNTTNYYTGTGIKNIFIGEYGLYSIRVSNSNYSARTYSLNVVSPESSYSLFLNNHTDTVSMTFGDGGSRTALEGVRVSMQRQNGSIWNEVQSGLSDVTGKIVFSYTPNVKYRFNCTLAEYNDKTFDLDPISVTSYIVYMTRNATDSFVFDHQGMSVSISPDSYIDAVMNNFSITFDPTNNDLTAYSVNVSYPCSAGICSNTTSGSAPTGGTLSLNIPLNATSIFQVVNVSYSYTISTGVHAYSYQYQILMNAASKHTLSDIKRNTREFYGIGVFEGVLMVVFVAIILGGITMSVGGTLSGFAVALFVFGIGVYIGLVPFWAVAVTFLVGVLVLGMRSGD